MHKNLSLIFSLGCCTLGNFLLANSAIAQEITTDGTTDTQVTPDGNGNFTINRGDRAGNNLFHSFDNFSVPTNGSAVFDNAPDISNIFSRVTGGNISNIDGLIQANDTNLFLINPAGIMFGSNARLDIGGSFLGTTADSILFEDGTFSAVDLDNPPLLTINAPIGLNFRDNPSDIAVSGSQDTTGNTSFATLSVLNDRDISLIGGNINLNDAILSAPGGKVELWGLSGSGTIEINDDNNFSFAENIATNDISSNNSGIFVNFASDGVGGSINLNGRTINLSNGSRLQSGIDINSGSAEAQAGDIVLNARDTINLNGEQSFISNSILGLGNAGDIILNAENEIVFSGGDAFAQVRETGDGNAGDIKVNTTNLTLLDGSQLTAGVLGMGEVGGGVVGNAGNIEINADSILLSNQAEIDNSTNGQGDTGLIAITTTGAIELNSASNIFNNVEPGGVGNSLGITINAQSLSIANGSQIQTLVRGISEENADVGEGNAGNINISVTEDVNFTGSGSGVFSSLETRRTGQAGNISITAGSLSLSEQASLSASSFGTGDAGLINITTTGAIELNSASNIFNNVEPGGVGNSLGITINAQSLSIANGSQIQTLVRGISEENADVGEGNAGNINISVTEDVNFTGSGSGVFSSLETRRTGQAGNISITAGSLSLSEQASLSASTFGMGDAGLINITTTGAIELNSASNIFNTVEPGGVGDSQGITINAQSLSVADGSTIQTLVRGISEENLALNERDAGDISIDVREDVSFTGFSINDEGDRIFSQATSRNTIGSAGNISVTADSLTLSDGAFLSSSTFGKGNAGNVDIDVENAISLNNDAQIFSNIGSNATAAENRSTVLINGGSLSLTEGSSIDTSVLEQGQGQAGNIEITVDGEVNISGFTVDEEGNPNTFSNVTSSLDTDAIGSAGKISITANSLDISDGAFILNSTFGQGDAGLINITTTGAIELNSASNIFNTVEAGGVGDSLGITINAQSLSIADGSTIQTLVRGISEENADFGEGNAGNINLDVDEAITLSGFSTDDESNPIASSAIFSDLGINSIGNAGNIRINSGSLSLSDGGTLSSSTFGEGNAGNINLEVDQDITIDGTSTIGNTTFVSGISTQVGFDLISETRGVGQGGNIDIKTTSLNITDGGTIFSGTSGIGDAGNITLNIQENITLEGNTRGLSNGVEIDILGGISSGVSLDIMNIGTAEGDAGDITIEAGSLTIKDGNQIANGTSGLGDAGDVSLVIDDFVRLSNTSNIRSNVESEGRGDGGDISINARSLTLDTGSQITAGVFRSSFGFTGGQGTAGDITIETADSVSISGVSPERFLFPNFENFTENRLTEVFSSGIFTSVEPGGSGRTSNISITTRDFKVADAGLVDAFTANIAELPEDNIDRGSITINADTFEATNGGQVITTTRGIDDAGDINLNIEETISISGSDSTFDDRLAEFGDTIVNNQGAESGIFANTSPNSTGNGGSIKIGIFKSEGENFALDRTAFTNEITLSNQGVIDADSEGTGNGGDISLRTEQLSLDNQAQILAETNSPQPDNVFPSEINLFIDNTLTLDNNSTISAQAANSANGGNISIDAENGFVIAFPSKGIGNDIRANASGEGRGGRINISAEQIFGLSEARNTVGVPNNSNDIDASSDDSTLDGSIIINTSDINPTRGATKLPVNTVEPDSGVAQACSYDRDEGTANNVLAINGRGGVPASPTAPLTSESVTLNGQPAANSQPNAIATSKGYIIPARGVVKTKDGRIILTANPSSSYERSPEGLRNCNGV